jgi:hypothetical protein
MKIKALRVPWRGCLLGILCFAGMALLAAAYLWIYMDYSGPTRVQVPHQAQTPDQAPYVLSAVQQQVVNEIGYPDSFTLLFYQDRDEQDGLYDIRFECWHYAVAGRDIAFVNGEMISDEPADAVDDVLLAAPYRPEQFAASMRLKDVLASARVSEYVRTAADPVLVSSGEVFFASQLTFGMKAGRLSAVETMALEAEG